MLFSSKITYLNKRGYKRNVDLVLEPLGSLEDLEIYIPEYEDYEEKDRFVVGTVAYGMPLVIVGRYKDKWDRICVEIYTFHQILGYTIQAYLLEEMSGEVGADVLNIFHWDLDPKYDKIICKSCLLSSYCGSNFRSCPNYIPDYTIKYRRLCH